MSPVPVHARKIVGSTLLVLASILVAATPSDAVEPQALETLSLVKLLEGFEFRGIGPYRGGRVTAVTGVRDDRDTFYMGSTGGGVWKTADGGVSWSSLTDGKIDAGSIGAVAVAPSDPNVIWVGTGSACPRGNVSPGRGVYRSTDAGKSWTDVGLHDSGQIARIRVHPEDPDRAWVAALGHIFGPNPERGVFRTTDGGVSWEKVLFVSERAGAVDLALDPTNPRVLFAGIWETERKPWTLTSGGDDSGLWRSTDGGDTWKELTGGLPEGTKGRIGVTVSAARPGRVWALIEAEEGGLFRSENGGEDFDRINEDRSFRQRAWYYTHVFADPNQADTVYIANVGLWRSVDGGKSFDFIRAPHGDHHDLWIHPEDSRVLINGNDGGANVSYNGGKSWSTQANQPTAEMYRVTVDEQFPYRVYGCQQDNSCVSLPSRTSSSGIARHDWWVIGGCESGHVAVDPRDPEVTYSGCYGGSIGRYDHATGEEREIMAYPQVAVGQAPRDLRYRFQWNAPIRLSPHDPSVLYHTSQVVHRSTDEGQSWRVVSPDLTRNETERQDYAGGPLTLDNTGVEVYGTIFAFEESPQTPGLLWAGTDDGRVHLSRDDAETWTEITPAGMPEWGQVNTIELSAHDPGRAFLAVNRYKMDDFAPYIFRTDDYGASWDLLGGPGRGIPDDHFVRVVREDPDRRGLLYAGTEFGLFVSLDDGAAWLPLQANLPVTPVTDLAVHDRDLVVATQGRSFWILDDLTPLHQLEADMVSGGPYLFAPRPAYRFGGGFSFGGGGIQGKNPPAGVTIQYLLGTEPEEELELEILDPAGQVLRTLSSTKPEPQAPSPWRRFIPDLGGQGKLSAKQGLNPWVWNFRLGDAELVEDAILWGVARGPRVAPGPFQVRMTLGDWTQTRDIEVLADPRLDVAQADYEAQNELATEIWRSLTESHKAIKTARSARSQIEQLAERLESAGHGEGVAEAADAASDRLTAVEERILQTKSESSQDILNYPPKLDNQLLGLLGMVDSGNFPPTDAARERYADLKGELDEILAELKEALAAEVAAFNDLVADKKLPAVILPES